MDAQLNAFPNPTGNVGELIRQKDWRLTPLGSPEGWPASLRTVLNLVLHAKFPMFISWGATRVFLYNDAYAEILGAKHPQALGGNFQDIWSEIWAQIEPIVEQSLQGIGSYWEDMPLTTFRKGYEEQTWFTFSYSPIIDDSGDVAGMYCVCTETTNAVLAERHKARELERMRELFRQAPGFTAVVREPEHIFELANDAFLELIGNRPIIGQRLIVAIPELVGQDLVNALNIVYASGEPFLGKAVVLKLQRSAGMPLEQRFVDFVYQPIRDFRGQVSGVFIQGNDVTQAILAEKALRASEERLRLLADTIPQLAWAADGGGNVHWYNERWYDYTGTTATSMNALSWEHFYAPEALASARRQWGDSIASGTPFEGTFPIRSAGGAYRMFYTRMVPLPDADGKVVQWFGTSTDVTVLEDAKNELAAASARKDEFLAMLAHELRNPLAPIRTAAELLGIKGLPHEKIVKSSQIISRQVANLASQLDDLLDVAQVTRGAVSIQPSPCLLTDLVAEAVEQTGPSFAAKRQTLAVHLPPATCTLTVDKVRIVQAIANVLDNAAKYTPEAGAITLDATVDTDFIRIVVEDNGIGIEKQLMPHVFELFTQAQRSPDRAQGGLGLGLALVKNLVERHGGQVSVASDGPGHGSRFVIQLPRARGASADHEPQAQPAAAPSSVLRVLLVDDNEDAVQTLATLLDTKGYATHAVYSAADALALAPQVRPDVCVLDLGLPHMDGYELARRLRALPETAGSRLIALSGYGQPEDLRRSEAAGFDAHLVKPAKLDALLKLLAGD
jgi:PAS domain S-box-containing protein